MIHVEKVDEPATFDAACRQPGQKWLVGHPDGDPHDNPLWSTYNNDLREAFQRRCGFLGHWIHRGTVDHWASVKKNRALAYEWTNYRYVAGEINSAKKPAWDGKLLDPFEVNDDWFEIQLPSMQLVFVGEVPNDVRARIDFTLDKLHLRDGEEVVRLRHEWVKLYEQKKLSLAGLQDMAPLIARAIAKRDGLVLEAPAK